MSFIASLFGGNDAKPQPTPVQSTPTANNASVAAADREQTARLNNRAGDAQSILTSGLGDTSAGPTNVNRTAALGGNTSLVA